MKKTLILGLIAMMALVANAQDQKKCACDSKCKTENATRNVVTRNAATRLISAKKRRAATRTRNLVTKAKRPMAKLVLQSRMGKS